MNSNSLIQAIAAKMGVVAEIVRNGDQMTDLPSAFTAHAQTRAERYEAEADVRFIDLASLQQASLPTVEEFVEMDTQKLLLLNTQQAYHISGLPQLSQEYSDAFSALTTAIALDDAAGKKKWFAECKRIEECQRIGGQGIRRYMVKKARRGQL